jgi:hypothetical protein
VAVATNTPTETTAHEATGHHSSRQPKATNDAHPEGSPPAGDTPAAAVKGDRDAAKRLVEEEADPDFEEENYTKAIAAYRRAIKADSTYLPAYKGLYKAGLGGADKAAMREGGRGYLKLAPDAPDAARVKENLEKL